MEYSLTARDSSSATDYVISQVKQLLRNGELKPGDRLPSEFELAERLGVSRGSVRSAMKVFESCGIIDIRRGDGTYVCSGIQEKTMTPLILSLYVLDSDNYTMAQFREKIELDILDLIFHSSDARIAELLAKLTQNLNEAEALPEDSLEEMWKNDVQFHKLLADYCGNVLFQAIYSYVLEYFSPMIKDSHNAQYHGRVAAKSHKQIVESIRNRDFPLGKKAISASMEDWMELLSAVQKP